MKRAKLAYILTRLSLFAVISCSLMLMILSWNGRISNESASVLMILLWTVIAAASIYLFLFAAGKITAHNLISGRKKKEGAEPGWNMTESGKKAVTDQSVLNVESTARKLLSGLSAIDENKELGNLLLGNLSKELEIMSGVVYFRNKSGEFIPEAFYAVPVSGNPYTFKEGEGICGQVVRNMQINILSSIPENYLAVKSGLGSSKKGYLALIPVIKNHQTVMLIECAGFKYNTRDLERALQLLSRGLSEMMQKSNP